MLMQLSIHHLALIDDITIEFGPGLNVLTGETGAGKSIVVDAVNLVLGERADRDLIANGQKKAYVDAVFDLTGNTKVTELLSSMELMDEEENTVSISRELTVTGKNICRINGIIVPLQSLRQVSAQLLDIHGQHEHQLLLDTKNHIAYLDEYGEDELGKLLEECAADYSDWRQKAQKLARLRKSVSEREQRMDMLRFQVDELVNAQLVEHEEEELERKKVFYRNAGRIMEAFDEACRLLNEGDEERPCASELLREGIDALTPITALDSRYEAVYTRLDGLCYEIEDAIEELTDLRSTMDYDQEDAENTENRLDTLRRLSRKYGATTGEMIAYRDKAAAELSELNDSDELMERLEKDFRASMRVLEAVSVRLTHAREEVARRFEKHITEQLRDLGMPNARLSMAFSLPDKNARLNERFSAIGVDKVEMMFCANLGQPMKPLAKVASGGELSRIMLALKNLSAQKPGIPRSMVFDEIDTGISGRTAQVVPEKMSEIGSNHQVICVTHLPQIAAMADEQYLVRKSDLDGLTRTRVEHLSRAERALELARMVGGVDCESDSSVRHASVMLDEADARKKKLREFRRETD